jgi:hypothetical protein
MPLYRDKVQGTVEWFLFSPILSPILSPSIPTLHAHLGVTPREMGGERIGKNM